MDVTGITREVVQDITIPITATDTVFKLVSPDGTGGAIRERRTRDLLRAACSTVAKERVRIPGKRRLQGRRPLPYPGS